MARNDVFLNINALSPADAVVTAQQDMTAATVPELVLGDTPTFNFYFTDNTNVWPSWAGNAAYTVTWALSDAVSGDFSPAATTGNATPITGGWSVVLPLNAYDLVGLLNTKRVSQPYPVTNLWQQIRVADPSGNEVTRAMFWTPIRYRAISDTQNTESASPTGGREVTVDNVNVLTTPTAAQFYAANPVPTSALGSAANGELLIGNGTGFTKATLTAGDGITITNASGSITIDASAAEEKLTATVKNAESTPITKGQVVYLFGATGNIASVKLAYNTSDATSAKTFGVVSSSSIAANGTGLVTCVGVVDGLNLGAYQDGDTLYLGDTPGSVTATKPYAPNHLVYVGIVERANAGNGELYVKVQNGYELDEIHDVQINAPRQSGQTLIYDNTTSLWKNARITAGSNIAVTNGDGSISIGFSGTLPVANGGTGVTTSTGSGSVVLSTSPTLTTPILGTPQSGTLSSCTGLPISTGVSGLGTNVATFLATPSSANLAFAVTDETGTGALVFANTPTLVTPNIGAATGTSVNLSGAGTFGGNLTVSGTGESTFSGTIVPAANITKNFGKTTAAWLAVYAKYLQQNDASGYLTSNTDGSIALNSQSNQNITLTPHGTGGSVISKNESNTNAITTALNYIKIQNTNLGGTYIGALEFYTWDNRRAAGIFANRNSVDGTSGILSFAYSTSGNSFAEGFRLNSTGNFLVGTTTDGGQKLQVNGVLAAGTTGGDRITLSAVAATDQYFLAQNYWNDNGTENVPSPARGSWRAVMRNATSNTFNIDWRAANAAAGTFTNLLSLDSSGNATFAGKVTVNGTDGLLVNKSASLSVITMGEGIAGSYSRFNMRTGSAKYAWSIAAQDLVDNALTITPSTAVGGTTFTTPVLTVAQSGAVTVSGSIAIGNTVNTVSPTSPNRTITMVIGGTTYYIHAKTTND